MFTEMENMPKPAHHNADITHPILSERIQAIVSTEKSIDDLMKVAKETMADLAKEKQISKLKMEEHANRFRTLITQVENQLSTQMAYLSHVCVGSSHQAVSNLYQSHMNHLPDDESVLLNTQKARANRKVGGRGHGFDIKTDNIKKNRYIGPKFSEHVRGGYPESERSRIRTVPNQNRVLNQNCSYQNCPKSELSGIRTVPKQNCSFQNCPESELSCIRTVPNQNCPEAELFVSELSRIRTVRIRTAPNQNYL
uniref:Mediator of RNA polymerase II transcription subunit 11 n=1 Tax=Caenorhabditis japonica TaxID=281687 RepID=A0A8R1EL11_CAEJA